MTSLLDRQASVGTADGGRRRRGSDLLQMGWLPSTVLPFLAPFIAISVRSGNRFHFLVIYRIVCFIFWDSKMVHGSGFFVRGIKLFSMPV